jgi:diguanylate cyclase (GGDEF)-like protein
VGRNPALNIAARLSLIFLVTALLMGGLASVATAFREYQIQLDRVTHTAASQLQSRPDLQFHIYRQDKTALANALQEFLASEPVISAVVYSNLGEMLASHKSPQGMDYAPAAFDRIRGNLLTVDEALVTFNNAGSPLEPGLFSSLFRPDQPIYYSLPVFTLVNPAERGLSAADFAIALTSGVQPNSQWVIGYLHVLIDRGALGSASLSAATRVFFIVLLLVVICGVIVWVLAQRITRPLRQLTELADDFAAGKLDGPLEIEGSGELAEFARIINSFLSGIQSFKNERETNNHLLNMKVEERNSQLTERNEELNKAVEEVEQTRSRLHHIANYDGLTNLPNRQLFTEQLDLLLRLNRRNKSSLALLFIDLDDFKRVNDSLGISVGDRLLQEVARRLSEAVRNSDSIGYFSNSQAEIAVSRLGGDEFTVVLNEIDTAESTQVVAQRLVDIVAQPITIEGHELIIRPAIGIAMAPTDGANVEQLLRAASIAKQYAKEHGNEHSIRFYSRDMAEVGAQRMRMESDLRKAIERGELALHYQPQVDTHSGSVVGAEALLRWEHPDLGMIAPGDFIRMAEDIGYMEELGDWVLVEACRQVQEFNEQGVKLPKVAINVSALQFDARFVRRIAEVLQISAIPPSQLELGLTEGIMTSNEPGTVDALRGLQESGVYLSVDDFGTGYSPLNYLSQYPLDELKIDRNFLLESERSDNGAKLVVAIIAMATSLDLRVLAAGVETPAQLRFLTDHGAHIIQGYLFSEPVPAEQLKPMLAPWHFMERVQKLAQKPSLGDEDT